MAPTKRYFRPGVTKILWSAGASSLADYTAPTRVEIDACVDLSAEVAEIEGFQVTSNTLDTPDFGSRFNSKIPSDIVSDDSALNTYADNASVDVRSVLQRNDDGYVIIMDEGDTAGLLMDVFPTRVAATPKLRSRSDPAMIRAQFTVTREPAENATIPA
jgi:hypothetical protein